MTSKRELEAKVLSALTESKRGPLKVKELARAVGVPGHEYRAFRRLVTGMEKAGRLVRARGHRYALAESGPSVEGVLAVTRSGDGFVRASGSEPDVFVSRQAIGDALDGDRVVARLERTRRGPNREGRIVRVVERAHEIVVGTIHVGRRFSYVVPLDRRMGRDVLISEGEDGDAHEGAVVVVRIVSFGDRSRNPTGRVEAVLGDLGDPGVDVLVVAHGHGLALDFPERVIAAAESAARAGMDEGGPHRVDRTELLCFTIDPADAKDHDDALSVRAVGDRFEVGVHIADVSHFVTPGSPVDDEAVSRATSVYLVDRTVPMLPDVLSGEVCSLHHGAPRFALSLFLEMDGEGRVHERHYERTVIECRESLSYEDAQGVLDGSASISPEIDEALRRLDDLARHLRRQRRDRGSLDMDLPEAKVVLDDSGVPVDIQRRARLSSHRLIEDFMILANEVVANDLEARVLPGLFRVHETPTEEKGEQLRTSLAAFGASLPDRRSLKPKDLQRVLDQVRDTPAERAVSTLVLRSMQKARYSPDNLGHFGLASGGYAHFTSPIRRYPDLVVHRAIVAAFIEGRTDAAEQSDGLDALADRCSERERAAEEAERASVQLKKVEFMQRHLGEEFTGWVSSVASFGLFVTLDDYFVEGLVHVRSMGDDYFEFDERRLVLQGARARRGFGLGDAVRVQLARADKETRQIDFMLLGRAPGSEK